MVKNQPRHWSWHGRAALAALRGARAPAHISGFFGLLDVNRACPWLADARARSLAEANQQGGWDGLVSAST